MLSLYINMKTFILLLLFFPSVIANFTLFNIYNAATDIRGILFKELIGYASLIVFIIILFYLKYFTI
jgi:hypothetical protein